MPCAAASFISSVICGRARVERAAEEAGEAEHVVDLVRVVGAAGGDDPHVRGGLLGHHLGLGVGHREHHRVVVHAVEVCGLDHARARQADEQVGALEHVRGPAGAALASSCSRRTSA